ncbi:MAG: hypothetical protein IJV80_03810, partial [Clostridia bacterium]|nr:hypothetical protein [Clostridia bacterium]
ALTGGKTERTFSFDASAKNDVLYVDNEHLYFALRCLNDYNTSLLCYSDAHRAVKTVEVSFGSSASEKFTFVKNGVPYSQTLDYTPISISYEGKNSGAIQNFHIAKKTNITKNENRNVILKFNTSISYGIGHIIYTLTEANFA